MDRGNIVKAYQPAAGHEHEELVNRLILSLGRVAQPPPVRAVEQNSTTAAASTSPISAAVAVVLSANLRCCSAVDALGGIRGACVRPPREEGGADAHRRGRVRRPLRGGEAGEADGMH